MSTITKDLGVVTAYGYYKAGGGTMTEAEFTQFMVDFGAAAKTATDAARAALASENAAKNSEETATRKASEAGESASTASTKAGEAAQSASDADTAKNDAVSAKNAAETAQGKAEDAQAAAEAVAESIPSDYSQLSEDVSDVKENLQEIQTATAEDVGKALKAKTVTDGKVTEWEFGEAGGTIKSDVELAYETINNSYVDRDGTFKEYNNWSRTDYIDISGCTDLKANISTSYAAFYAEDKSFVEPKIITADVVMNIPVNARYIAISATTSVLSTLIVSAQKSVDITEVIESKLDKSQGTENAGKVLVINTQGNIEPADVQINVDPTLNISGAAADAKVTGDRLINAQVDNLTALDNINCVFGSISNNNGAQNSDTTHKNVCGNTFYKASDYAGVKKANSSAYRMDLYFYASDSRLDFIKAKNQEDIDHYIFSSEEKSLYFKIQFRSNTDDVLNTSTRYGYLLTDKKTKVTQKNEDKRNAIVTAKGKNQSNFSLLVMTDIHGDEVRMLNAISYLNEMDKIDAGACLGDISAGTYATDCAFYSNAVLNAEKPFFTVIGNHDAGNATAVSTNGTQQQIFDKFIAPVVEKTGTETSTSYYYKDFADKNVRVIVLNSSDVPDTLANETTFLVSHGVLGAFSQAQINWFISTLASTPTGYHVLILMHYVNAPMTHDTNIKFQSSTALASGRENNAYVGIINDIVSAWVTGGTLSQTYTSTVTNMPDVSVSADFTSRGTGVFIGVLAGHMHRDIIGKFDNYPSQVACVFSLANQPRGSEDDLPRIKWEKSEDLLTVVSLDTTNRKLYLVRVGANLAIDFAEREDTCISY